MMRLSPALVIGALIACGSIVWAQPVVPGAAKLAAAPNADLVAVGKVLLTELNCVACHSSPRAERAVGRKGAPDLSAIGSRVSPTWFRAFLLHPHEVRPGTTMPDLLRIADRGRDRDVDHLVNFLSSLGGPLKPGTLPVDAAMVEEGRKLYHTIGCVACHDAEKGVGEPTSGGVPIEDIWTKTTVEKLAEFLRDPLKTRPSGRMPSLRLSDRESVAIAAYLCRKQEPNNFRGPPGMADFVPDAALIPIGKRMFINLGCADCHKLEGYKSKVFAPTFSRNDLDVRSGCLDWHVPRGLPMYQLTDAQIEAIRAALDSEQREHWGEPVPLKQQIAVTLGQLNCYACHSRDEVAGIEPTRLPYFHSTLPPETGVEGRIPPPLTGVGQRLNEQMLTEIMVNSRGFMRPFLLTRMPTFGAANVEPLVKQFIEADRAVRQPAVEAPGKPGG